MKFCLALMFALLTLPALASDVSWIFLPGYYTHRDGVRVNQYEPERPSYVTVDPTYQESGYRRQTIRTGNDYIETTQTWGVQPYYAPRYYPYYYRPYY